MKTSQLLSVLLLPALLSQPALAANPNEPQTLTVSVHPAAPPRPALKYRLLHEAVEKTPGDAAPLYLLAAGSWQQGENNFAEKMLTADELAALKLPGPPHTWSTDGTFTWATAMLEMPLGRLESPELQRVLQTISRVYPMLELATKRERCEWNIPLREHGFATLLPHLANLRGLTRVVCVKARWHLSKGEWNEAVAAMRVNIALVRALDREAVLIQQLVGTAIGSMTMKVVEEAQSLPKFPNLYWALASLPNPMIDRRNGLEMERAATYWSIPELLKVRDGSFTEADWQTMLPRLEMMMDSLGAERVPTNNKIGSQLKLFGMALMIYPAAKTYLVEKGMTPEEVEKLPKPVAIARYFVESYEETYDNMVKWSSLPYWQARKHNPLREKEINEIKRLSPSNPLMAVIPAVSRAMSQLAKLDRLIAAQQTVEALRAHAAANDGKLPATLDDIKETPAPMDPMTGKPFIYKVAGNEVTLESLDANQPGDGLMVKVTLKK